MEVFISWSGERSGRVAGALRDWLPNVIQSVTPFMSASDIDKGSRWANDLASHLEEAQFGLICLTPENLEAPWLLFEAGALSKSMDNSRVVPYLYGVSQAQLEGPLAQFQAASADKYSTLDVIQSINGASEENRLESTRIETAFETWWPQLESEFTNIPETTEKAAPSRTDRDILEEILRLSRQTSRQMVPNTEIEQDALRNLIVHGFHTELGDSPEGSNDENRRSAIAAATIDAIRGQAIRDGWRRPLDRIMRASLRTRQSHPPSVAEAKSEDASDRES